MAELRQQIKKDVLDEIKNEIRQEINGALKAMRGDIRQMMGELIPRPQADAGAAARPAPYPPTPAPAPQQPQPQQQQQIDVAAAAGGTEVAETRSIRERDAPLVRSRVSRGEAASEPDPSLAAELADGLAGAEAADQYSLPMRAPPSKHPDPVTARTGAANELDAAQQVNTPNLFLTGAGLVPPRSPAEPCLPLIPEAEAADRCSRPIFPGCSLHMSSTQSRYAAPRSLAR
eukprot:gene14949-6346_t